MNNTQALPIVYERSTRQERMEQAIAVIERGGGLPLSVIASRMGLAKTPYLKSIVLELVEMELVRVSEIDAGFGIPTKIYSPVYGANGVS